MHNIGACSHDFNLFKKSSVSMNFLTPFWNVVLRAFPCITLWLMELVILLDGKKAHAWSFCWIREMLRWAHGYLEGISWVWVCIIVQQNLCSFAFLANRDSFEDELRAFDGGVDGFLPCVWDDEISNFPQVAVFLYVGWEMVPLPQANVHLNGKR
jgi:hypothetical protein